MIETAEAIEIKPAPIYEYLASRENKIWRHEDSLYVRSIFQRVEALAAEFVERAKRTAALAGKSAGGEA